MQLEPPGLYQTEFDTGLPSLPPPALSMSQIIWASGQRRMEIAKCRYQFIFCCSVNSASQNLLIMHSFLSMIIGVHFLPSVTTVSLLDGMVTVSTE